MLTSKQRAYLRGEAQKLEPIVYVGKGGVGQTLLEDAEGALKARELIKGTVLENCPLSAREAADILAEKLGADPVQVIGRRFVLYKESDTPDTRRFDLQNFARLLPEEEKKRTHRSKTGTADAKKPPVKPGYRRAIARKKEEERRKELKAEKAAYFREKARAERIAARSGRSPAESTPPASESRYTILRREKK